MSVLPPTKSILLWPLLALAVVLWNREPGDSFWGYTLPWSVGTYLAMTAFFIAYSWWDNLLRRKVGAYGAPTQAVLETERRRNSKIRRELGLGPVPYSGSVDSRVGHAGRLTARTIVDWVAMAAAAVTGLEIGIKYTLWRLSSDYSYEADRPGPLLDEMTYLFGKLGYWAAVFGCIGVLVHVSRGLQGFIWDVLPNETSERWQEIDRLRHETKALRATRNAAKRTKKQGRLPP